MSVLSITRKDIQILLKDRGVVLQLFVLPLLFILVFSGALGQVGKEPADSRIALAVVDLDGGAAAQDLMEDIDNAGGVRVERYDEADALELVRDNDIPRVLIIPAGYSPALAARQPATLRLVTHPNADARQTEAVRLVVDGVAQDATLELQIMAALQQMGEMQAAMAGADQAFGIERMQGQARSQFEQAQTQPLIGVVQKVPGDDTAQEEDNSLGLEDVAVPGVTVLFVFWAAQTTARSIYDEKKGGSFRRLLAAPVSKTSLLAGKMVPNFLTGIVQSAVIFAFGLFGLRLMGLTPITLGNDPLATVLVILLLSLCSSALGILIAALARTEGQIGGLSNLALFAMAIVGGSFIPIFILEQFLGPVPMIVPHYWANRALVDLMVRGAVLSDVLLEMAVLLGFTVLFFAVGTWRFEFD